MNEITEDYVSYDIAKLLKEKGFNIPCFGRYSVRSKNFHIDCTKKCNNGGLFEYAAPTFQMVRKWLRDTYNLYLFNEYFGESKTYKWRIIEMNSTHKHSDFKHYNTEEEATEASFKYALENLI